MDKSIQYPAFSTLCLARARLWIICTRYIADCVVSLLIRWG